jgi:DinB superfamily
VHKVTADTVSAMETCEDCGFAWVRVGCAEIGLRAVAAARQIANVIVANADLALVRPTPERWSALEYAAHVRDVFLTIRDRLVIGLVEDEPGFKPMYRDERISLGLYSSDTAVDVAAEVVAAANMLTRLLEAIDQQQLDRVVQYGFPDPLPRTLLWMGQQAVHESEHHLADITENVGAV